MSTLCEHVGGGDLGVGAPGCGGGGAVVSVGEGDE